MSDPGLYRIKNKVSLLAANNDKGIKQNMLSFINKLLYIDVGYEIDNYHPKDFKCIDMYYGSISTFPIISNPSSVDDKVSKLFFDTSSNQFYITKSVGTEYVTGTFYKWEYVPLYIVSKTDLISYSDTLSLTMKLNEVDNEIKSINQISFSKFSAKNINRGFSEDWDFDINTYWFGNDSITANPSDFGDQTNNWTKEVGEIGYFEVPQDGIYRLEYNLEEPTNTEIMELGIGIYSDVANSFSALTKINIYTDKKTYSIGELFELTEGDKITVAIKAVDGSTFSDIGGNSIFYGYQVYDYNEIETATVVAAIDSESAAISEEGVGVEV